MKVWVIALAIFLFCEGKIAAQTIWRDIAQGLELGSFGTSKTTPVGTRQVDVLRIDPEKWKFDLLTASNHDKRARRGSPMGNRISPNRDD